MKTATFFSLALFPQVFLFERVLNSDVVFVLSNRQLDDHNHANHCVLRSATGVTRKIEIPIRTKDVPIDKVDVPDFSTWFPALQEHVSRIYAGLPSAVAARELVSQLVPPYPDPSPWLTDYLMHSFVMTLKYLGWNKEIVRGATEHQRRYGNDPGFALGLCLEERCQCLIVGAGNETKNEELFRKCGVSLVAQRWRGSSVLRGRDSILDAVARLPVTDILSKMRRN